MDFRFWRQRRPEASEVPFVDLGPFSDLHAADEPHPLGGQFACPLAWSDAVWVDGREPAPGLEQIDKLAFLAVGLESAGITPAFDPSNPLRSHTMAGVTQSPCAVVFG